MEKEKGQGMVNSEQLHLKTQNSKPTLPMLIASIFLDVIGAASSSWVIPGLGDFSDIIWAPLAGLIAFKMYKDNVGKATSFLFPLIEEALPFTDIIPSFTILWLYSYFTGKKDENLPKELPEKE